MVAIGCCCGAGGVPMWPLHESIGASSTPSGGSKNKGGRRKYKGECKTWLFNKKKNNLKIG